MKARLRVEFGGRDQALNGLGDGVVSVTWLKQWLSVVALLQPLHH